MSDSPQPATAVADIDLAVGDGRLRTRVEVPTTPMSPTGLLPLARAISHALVDVAVKEATSAGRKISCKAGCGACCRQLVPVTEVEARSLRALVEAMPEPRRSEILARFQRARTRLAEADLLSTLENRQPEESLSQLGMRYFALGIPCPFLENESCSIYEERPLICRDYLVTSPAEACRAPTRETVHCLPLSFKVWPALAYAGGPRSREEPTTTSESPASGGVDAERPGTRPRTPWLALTLALDWAAANPEGSPEWTGPELVNRFFSELTGKNLPASPLPPAAGGNGDAG
jgi:Fe-S-cluster containining protein